jgi:hypothetical protein
MIHFYKESQITRDKEDPFQQLRLPATRLDYYAESFAGTDESHPSLAHNLLHKANSFYKSTSVEVVPESVKLLPPNKKNEHFYHPYSCGR